MSAWSYNFENVLVNVVFFVFSLPLKTLKLFQLESGFDVSCEYYTTIPIPTLYKHEYIHFLIIPHHMPVFC